MNLYFKNGKLKAEGITNEKGRWMGHWKEYFSDGVLKWEGDFYDGKKIISKTNSWPDFTKSKGGLDIFENPDTLIVGKS